MGALSSQLLGVGEVEQARPGKGLPLVAFFVHPVVGRRDSDLRGDSVSLQAC